MKNLYSGVVNLYKPKNMSSNSAMQKVRTIFDRAKGGHTGTLDPDAEGILPIVLGKCTKLSNDIMSDEKEYRAHLILGTTTDTLDLSGTVLNINKTVIDKDSVISAIKSFQKEYEQLPPMYSAIKVDGKKLYDLARQGVTIDRKKRLVNIKKIDVIEVIDDYTYVIDVTCSKGTYIRSLCQDIGDKLLVGGCMGKLVRTRTGQFSIENSYTLEELEQLKNDGNLSEALITTETLLKDYQKAVCSPMANKFLINGNKINTRFLQSDKGFIQNQRITIYNDENILVGLYIIEEDFAIPDIILHTFS